MSQMKRASRSTYRAILSVQADRDEMSGLAVNDRYFVPSKETKLPKILKNTVDIGIPAVLVCGLLILITSGLQIRVGVVFYIPVLAYCIALSCLCRSRWYRSHSFLNTAGILIIWLAVCFAFQSSFVRGARLFAECLSAAAHNTYSHGGQLQSVLTTGSEFSDVRIFLMLASVPAVYWICVAMFRVHQMIMIYMAVFPVVICLALLGAADSNIGLLTVLTAVFLCRVYMGTRVQKRMWGGRRASLKSANAARYEHVQKTSVGISLLVAVVLFVPGYFLVRPLLSVSMKPLENLSMRVQSSFLSEAVKILPDVSAGRWNLVVESAGSGVDEGSLRSEDGYLIDNVEDIRVTIDTRPEETIFLRGFVGSEYRDGKWSGGYGTTFDAAAMNWNTDGSPRLYVQNLPFLRTSYALSQMDGGEGNEVSDTSGSTALMSVERINANDKYTYVPYGVYLNDYYTVEAGDGYVAGQSIQDDRFPFYFRKDMEKVLTDWNESDNDNVLDRVEESYRAYCESSCLGQSDEYSDLTELKNLTDSVISENRWKGQADLDDITAWIGTYLDNNYKYEREPVASPDNVDELEYFMYTSKKGNSVQFASMAVMMYRLFGIPARYAVGYELPYSMFTAQPDGTYTVTATGENSQAWVEIYSDGIGWIPEDVTPGVIGSYEEAGPGAELIEQSTAESASDQTADMADTDGSDGDMNSAGGVFFRRMSMGQIVMRLMFFLVILGILTGAVLLTRWYCNAFGYSLTGRRSAKQRLLTEFSVFYSRMRRLGLSEGVTSQDAGFITFCEHLLHPEAPDTIRVPDTIVSVDVGEMLERLYAVCYGGEEATETDVVNLRKLVKCSFRISRRKCKMSRNA